MELSKEQKILSAVLNRAWEDEDFKQRLIDNPAEEIEKLTGQKVKVPAGKKLIIMDQTNSDEIYINLPPKPEEDDIELSEDQLDIVSGGGGPTPPKLGDPTTPITQIID